MKIFNVGENFISSLLLDSFQDLTIRHEKYADDQ
jgi:hypothetical protein